MNHRVVEIYRHVESSLQANKFDELSNELAEIAATEFGVLDMLCYLRATFCAKIHIANYEPALQAFKERFPGYEFLLRGLV